MKKITMLVLTMALLANTALALAQDVFVTKNGKKYHTSQDCRWVKNKQTTSMDEKAAIEKGYKPCGRCASEKNKEGQVNEKK